MIVCTRRRYNNVIIFGKYIIYLKFKYNIIYSYFFYAFCLDSGLDSFFVWIYEVNGQNIFYILLDSEISSVSSIRIPEQVNVLFYTYVICISLLYTYIIIYDLII